MNLTVLFETWHTTVRGVQVSGLVNSSCSFYLSHTFSFVYNAISRPPFKMVKLQGIVDISPYAVSFLSELLQFRSCIQEAELLDL